jgi:hypothetical protein
MLAMLVLGGICDQFPLLLQVLGVVWVVVGVAPCDG